jgi:hypothetical protein
MSIGVYSPSVTRDSRCAYESLFNQDSGNLRQINLIEGFIFLTRVNLLSSLKIPLERSKFGWCLDALLCYSAYSVGKIVVVDDRCLVYHPKSINPINDFEAKQEAMTLIPQEVFEWTTYAKK